MKKKQRQILIGFGSCIALLVVGAVGFLSLQQLRTPLMDLVPAERTIAFFEKTTLPRAKAVAGPRFPVLQDIPQTEGSFSLAIIKGENGAQQWILSPELETTTLEGRELQRFRGKPVYVSDGASLETLSVREGEEPLSASAVFLALFSRTYSGEWAYFSEAPQEGGDARISSLLGEIHGDMLLEQKTDGGIAIHFADTISKGSTERYSLPMVAEGGICVGVNSADQFFSLFSSQQDALLQQRIAAAAVENMLGTEVSLQYDLLPLLKRPSIGCGSTTTESKPAGLFLGEINDRSLWDRLTAEWHASALANTAGGTIDRRLIDGKYTYEVLKNADASLETGQTNVNGWEVRSTAGTGSGGLFTARKGLHVLVATSREWLNAGLTEPLAIVSGTSAGVLDPGTPLVAPPALQPILSVFFGQKALVWSRNERGGIVTLTIQPQ